MRIAFVSQGSPFTRAAWSGIPYYSLQETRRRFADVHVIDSPRLDRLIARSGRMASFGLLPARERPVTAVLAMMLERRLRDLRPDVVLSVGAPHKVVDLRGPWRIVHVTDAMFASIVSLYPKYANLSRRSLRMGNAMQARLIDRAQALLVCSEWAADSAAELYRRPRERFTVAPMGANLDHDPDPAPVAPGPLRLLFMGFDWLRKGGPLVLAAFRALAARAPGAELNIVGCTPAEAAGIPGVTVHGRIDKQQPAGRALLEDLFRSSHFFFMPSRQEAYGLVYCEACAYGLPSIAAETGGVGTIVQHGGNGLLLPATAGPDAFADAILSTWADPAAYAAMRHAALAAYRERLNWRAWGAALEAGLNA